jgi:8-oxo-dGTP pyrophosphatase MutT (NUDIX family)
MPMPVSQSAAIPILDGRICMVTSSSGKRWVIPKGQIDPGHTPAEAALQEAWEEAGVVGALDPNPIGNYIYEKLGNQHHVLVYVLRVLEARDVWPESGSRNRVWLTVAEAIERIEEQGLRELLRHTFLLERPQSPSARG